MDDIIIPGHENDRRAFQQVTALHGPPAFAVRAQRVQEALDGLVAACRKQREDMLDLVRIRLGTLQALAGDWQVLRPFLAEEHHLENLQQMFATLQPQLRIPVERTSSTRALRRALLEVRESLERFNQRWEEFLHKVSLTRVNELREGYNKYYVLEKECVLRSARLARQGFRPLPPVTLADLVALFPPLAVPELL